MPTKKKTTRRKTTRTPRKVTAGVKYDGGKLRWDLLPPEAMNELVYVYTYGASKYADRNWEQGLRWGRVFAAMMRHAWAWWAGESRHEERMHSLASVAWCALALMTFEQRHIGEDDRICTSTLPATSTHGKD